MTTLNLDAAIAALAILVAVAGLGGAAWGCSEMAECNARCGPGRTGHDGPFIDCRCINLEEPPDHCGEWSGQ